KSYIAEALHKQSTRKHGPFVAVNCGAIPEDLLESQLFGHEKGAFTGAESRHIGFFEEADGGTLFLDEIGELPMGLQSKLLLAVERKRFRRIGGAEIKVDVRIISATNRSMAQEIEASRFREDLYHRIAVMELEAPPLRDRREDIPLLAEYFLAHKFPDQAIQLAPDAIKALHSFDWPGNIRQLNN
ncbi:MAG: sigma-54-dependent Fis family transcriptional regulator, partial [Candidatus Competibacteraceae bacterium]|nr:sigma-54-dependent Fis family transcriptional regulator [Candidatus Competibacteraceae bacterium]